MTPSRAPARPRRCRRHARRLPKINFWANWPVVKLAIHSRGRRPRRRSPLAGRHSMPHDSRRVSRLILAAATSRPMPPHRRSVVADVFAAHSSAGESSLRQFTAICPRDVDFAPVYFACPPDKAFLLGDFREGLIRCHFAFTGTSGRICCASAPTDDSALGAYDDSVPRRR